ncbi:putative purine permease 11 [Panicum miliaceum]|uniref:Probable purine permease n=1 Tax=Panicum miliaceum TaxID=4540 RepID=A0A3L6RKQ0_PANMI|nr:putative purine permease 11 [Panicum miliaceum]
MAHAQEIQLQITGVPELESGDKAGDSRGGPEPEPPTRRLTRGRGVRWWALVAVDMLMLLAGGTVATLLSRLYYNSGGNSKWMATLTQSGGAPLLAIPLLLTPPPPAPSEEERRRPAPSKLAAVYLGIGVLIGVDNLMYAYALQYLPVSTFSLVAATQLAFNAVTSRLINAQRFTPLIANSVVVLTFAAALLGVGASSDGTSSGSGAGAPPRGRYAAGFVLTLAASAVFALILSLYELAFERVVRARTPRWVLRTQMHTNLVASAVAAAGLLASGEWRTVPGEMAAFRDGPARYVLTLAGAAASWQVALAGQVRLVARVSSLFANATGAVQLPLVPVFAVVLFGDRMTGVKAVAMLMAVWGFLSYVYQHYLDGRRAAAGKDGAECAVCAARAASDVVSSAS